MGTLAGVLSLVVFLLLPSNVQTSVGEAASVHSKPRQKRQNIAPEEMWKRVTRCVFPAYSERALNAHIEGTVDIGFEVSPSGQVDNIAVLSAPPELRSSADGAISQWTFQPNVAQDKQTWSRIRALVHFNSDGTTAVDLAHAMSPDDFGDPGIRSTGSVGTMAAAMVAVPRPTSAAECEVVPQPLTGAQAKEIQVSETGLGVYKNHYFGLSFHFPRDWRVADRDTLDAMDAALPAHTLFFARADGPADSARPSVSIWTEKRLISGAEQYFANTGFLHEKTSDRMRGPEAIEIDGIRGPEAIEINGTQYFRGDRWGRIGGRTTYQVRLVSSVRALVVGIDVVADTAASAEQLVKTLSGLTITPQH